MKKLLPGFCMRFVLQVFSCLFLEYEKEPAVLGRAETKRIKGR